MLVHWGVALSDVRRVSRELASLLRYSQQNKTPFAVIASAGLGVAVVQKVVEALPDLRPRQMLQPACEVLDQLFPGLRFDHDDVVRCGHNESVP
jgi:hypothetical protein